MEYLTFELKKLSYIKLYGETSPNLKTPVLSFNMERFDSSEIGEALNKKEIYLRTSYHCAPLIHKIIGTEGMGTVRISPGFIIANINFYFYNNLNYISIIKRAI